ncbi:hypothetical protein D9M73_228950 [compost metagenome]
MVLFGQIPDIGQISVGITGNEQLLAAVGLIHRAPYGTDVGAIHMDADRDLVGKGVADLMDVADLRRHGLDLAWPQLYPAAIGDQGTFAVAFETL